MAVTQPTYSATFSRGYPGMVANGETSNRISRTVQDAAGIAYGRPVYRGTNSHDCTGTVSATAGALLGIAIANLAHTAFILPGQSDTGADVYGQYASAGILTQGVVWVTSTTAAAQNDPVYVTAAGAITNPASGNTVLPGWYFDETIAAAGIVKIAKR